MPWPAVGPDVTGGDVANVGGHVFHNPAARCYLDVLGGKTDGSSGVLSFDAKACYKPSSQPSGDAGADGGDSGLAGDGDAGGPAGGSSSSGCGCHVGTPSTERAAIGMVVVAALALVRRKRGVQRR